LTAPNGDSQLPILSPIAPSATSTSEAQTRLVDIQRQWEGSPHAQVEDAVDCQNCHQLQNGLATSELAWWNERSGMYEFVANSTDLCLKCHTEYDDTKSAHAQKACTDCHDEHMVKSSCFDCHDQIRMESIQALATPIDGHPGGMAADCEGSGCHSMATQKAQMAEMAFSIHGTSHANVSCEACHAADDFEVGPTQDENIWVLWRKIKINGETLLVPYRSHNLQYEVDCARCHFDGNPWNLPLVKN
jgi:hypothetical protein